MRAIAAQCDTAAHWTAEHYQEIFAPEPRRLALVLYNDTLHGFIVGKQAGPEWEIENIVAAIARRGFGSSLMAEFLDRVRMWGAQSVVLEVRAANATARRFYEIKGFVETGRRPNYYDHPLDDAVIYRLFLPTSPPPK